MTDERVTPTPLARVRIVLPALTLLSASTSGAPAVLLLPTALPPDRAG